jgi:hypothetical protein
MGRVPGSPGRLRQRSPSGLNARAFEAAKVNEEGGVVTDWDCEKVVGHFRAWGDYVESLPHGSGHIHDTFKVTFNMAGAPVHYLLQRINHRIFKNPAAIMDNILRVTNHVRTKLTAAGFPDVTRHSLCIVFTRNGKPCYQDEAGNWWRMYLFVEGACTYDTVESEQHAFEAARAYARFQALVADLPAPRLHETISNFHNTPMRLEALREAVRLDRFDRVKDVKSEIDFVESRADQCDRLLARHRAGEIPERVTHNDTKINNVMLDEKTGQGVCVIDLDTVMPGLALYDFGDMIRSCTAAAAEDERDLSRVRMRIEMFAALVRGYLSEATFLTSAEREELVFSGRLITLMIGMRFLTDYLSGDTYFKTERPGHNLDRCRTQFTMVASMESQAEEMERIVADSWDN